MLQKINKNDPRTILEYVSELIDDSLESNISFVNFKYVIDTIYLNFVSIIEKFDIDERELSEVNELYFNNYSKCCGHLCVTGMKKAFLNFVVMIVPRISTREDVDDKKLMN